VGHPDNSLAPGRFGNMRLASGGTERALLVPDTAVQTDQTRKLLLVVGRDGTVAAREVTLGPVIDGGLRVVRGGLEPTDRVIIAGTQMAFPVTKSVARGGRIHPPAPAADTTPATAAAAPATPPHAG